MLVLDAMRIEVGNIDYEVQSVVAQVALQKLLLVLSRDSLEGRDL